MKKWLQQILSLALVFSIGVGVSAVNAAQASTFKMVQTRAIALYTTQAASATTMRITPYPKDLDGTKLTYSDFGDTPTLTVDPRVSGIEEIESFTGITDNGDNTATLTGMSRDLVSKYPYTTTGTGRQHGSSAVVVFSNNPQAYGRLAAMENANSWYGVQTFSSTSMPKVDMNPSNTTWTGLSSSTLVTLGKLQDTALASAVAATTLLAGYVEMATSIEVASSTATGGTGANLAIAASSASSSPTTGCDGTSTAGSRCVVVASTTGKIPQSYLPLGEVINFTGGLTTNASSTLNSTTTVNGVIYGANVYADYKASSTLTGATLPQPVFVATSSNLLFLSDANVATDTDFLGFAVKNTQNAGTSTIQINGVVGGFTGLTAGLPYYVQDAVGTIGTSVGTNELYVGRALSSTQLLLDRKDDQWQYLGSQTCVLNIPTSCDTSSVPFARFAVANFDIKQGNGCSGPNTSENTFQITVYKVGATSLEIQTPPYCNAGTPGNSLTGTATFTSTSSVRFQVSRQGSTNGTETQTAYFYR